MNRRPYSHYFLEFSKFKKSHQHCSYSRSIACVIWLQTTYGISFSLSLLNNLIFIFALTTKPPPNIKNLLSTFANRATNHRQTEWEVWSWICDGVARLLLVYFPLQTINGRESHITWLKCPLLRHSSIMLLPTVNEGRILCFIVEGFIKQF